jgi:hypothetical protein
VFPIDQIPFGGAPAHPRCRCFVVADIVTSEEEGRLADIEAKQNAKDFRDGKLTNKKGKDIAVPKSLGAAAKKIYVKEATSLRNAPDKWIKEGTYITDVNEIYVGRQIRDVDFLIQNYPLSNGTFTKAEDWSKMVGKGIVTDGTNEYLAEIH